MATFDNDSSQDQRVVGSSGGDDITTGTGDDVIFARGGRDLVFSAPGNDFIFGESGNDLLNGVSGSDTISGGSGSDQILGNAGNDTLAVETGLNNFGIDVIEGLAGFDRVVFQTGRIIEVNDQPSQFFLEDATRGVAVNLINQFQPGSVGDFSLTASDAAGEDVFAFVTNARGQILDSTSLGSGIISEGITDLIEEPRAVFADIEEFVLTGFGDFFLDSTAGHIIKGGKGDDYISGGGGADVIEGGQGRDTALYRHSQTRVSVVLLDLGSGGSGSGGEANGDKLFDVENVHGSEFNDFALGDGNANVLRGFAGDDMLLGGNGKDTLSGGSDDDVLRGGLANDRVAGGDGNDTALFQDWNGYDAPFGSALGGTINLVAGTASLTATQRLIGRPVVTLLERDTLAEVENVTGSNVNETITGDSADNTLDGRDGNDVIDGGRGLDELKGGDDVDTATYASLIGRTVLGRVFFGVDASLADGEAAVRTGFILVDAAGLEADSLQGFENLTGSGGNDKLVGNAADNTISGLGGGDKIAGLGGVDRLLGGIDNDILTGGAGADTLNGGDGIDTADYADASQDLIADLQLPGENSQTAAGDSYLSIENLAGSDFRDVLRGDGDENLLSGADGNDTLAGRAGNDRLRGNGDNDTLLGGQGADTLDGGNGNDSVFGGDTTGDTLVEADTLSGGDGMDFLQGNGGDDQVHGDAGGDTVDGAAGNDAVFGDADGDSLNGGDGNDTLTGGIGADTLNGSSGADTFDYNAVTESGTTAATRDTISGFVRNADRIDLASIDAIPGGVDNAFAFRGTEAFSAAGQVRVVQSGGNTIVEVNTAGTGVAEMTIFLANVNAIGFEANEFFL